MGAGSATDKGADYPRSMTRGEGPSEGVAAVRIWGGADRSENTPLMEEGTNAPRHVKDGGASVAGEKGPVVGRREVKRVERRVDVRKVGEGREESRRGRWLCARKWKG